MVGYLLALSAPDAGGKARSLHRLATAGAPTPPGFAVADGVFRALLPTPFAPPTRVGADVLAALDEARAHLAHAAWPPRFADELAAALAALATDRFSVRSSFADEDAAHDAAPGVYASEIGVAASAVPAALRRVFASALAPGAVAYALARGRAPAAPPVAILVHAFVPGDAHGLAAAPVSRGTATDAAAGVLVLLDSERGQPTKAARAVIVELVARLAARRGHGVEVEWVARGDEVVLVQERRHAARSAAAARWPGADEVAAATTEQPSAPWRWDVEHNPEPLSPAQAALVAHVDREARCGFAQRVFAGYLFARPDAASAPVTGAEDPEAALAAAATSFTDRAARLPVPPPLEEALVLYVDVYRDIFGTVQPASRRARAHLRDWLARVGRAPDLPHLLAGVESHATLRRTLALAVHHAGDARTRRTALDAYLARFGDEAHAWDVAAPTLREDPAPLERRARRGEAAGGPAAPDATLTAADARRRAEDVAAALPAADRPAFWAAWESARRAVATGEDDDLLFARAQALIRRALLALGRAWRGAGVLDRDDDVFFLPLDEVRAAARTGTPPLRARHLVRAARAAYAAARSRPPPLPASTALAAPLRDAVRGHGTGGRALGRVRRHGGAATPSTKDVLVAATLLPAELPLVEAAALVIESGGPLGHVAAQARDRALPAVVGAAGALALLVEGDLALVDADLGLVIRVGR